MSNKPREGDKYVIEIEGVYGRQITIPAAVLSMDIPVPAGPMALYTIKGFPSVVFTEEDLKKLEKYEVQSEKPWIGVGDEVLGYKEERIAVTRVFWEDGQIWFEGVNGKGEIRSGNASDVEPTGRKVPGITGVLEFLQHPLR